MLTKKTVILLLLFVLTGNHLFAQTEAKEVPISIGYYAHFGLQPGLKVGAQFDLKKWEKKLNIKKNDLYGLRNWFLSPQLGFFNRSGDDNNYVVNLEAGFKRHIDGRTSYSAISVGVGYLLQSKLQSFAVNLGSGQTESRLRSSSHFFMPTLNYEFGWATDKKIHWYTKSSLGSKFSGKAASSFVLFIEVGIKLSLKANNKGDQ